MPELLRLWRLGPARACPWKHGLPLPGHRTMGEVLAQESGLKREPTAFDFVRKREETVDAERPDEL